MEKFRPSYLPGLLYGAAVFVIMSAIAQAFSSILGISLLVAWWVPYALFFLIGAVAALYKAAPAFTTTYSLEGSSLVMEKSFIVSDKKIIPIKSVDNLHITVSVLGRLLNLSDVYVDTPGGEGYELYLRDIPAASAQQLAEEVEKAKKI